MIVITKREFGVDLDLTSIIYSYGSFLFFEAVDCKQNRYFVTYSLVGSKEEQLQTQYTERYADYCVIRKMIPIPGGTCCCIIISAEWNALANTSIISKELHCLESDIGLNSNEISCRIVVKPPQCIGADILWNRFDIRYSSNVKWCEVKCGESRYMVAVHDEGRRLRIGILFFPLGVEVIRTLLAYLFDTHPSAEIISYQTTGFSLLESWKSVQEQRSICFVLNLDSMHSGIEQRSSRKTRYNLNRSRQLLEKAVGSLEVQAYSADNCPHEIVERYFKMKTARYALCPEERSASSLFSGSRLPVSHVYVLKSNASVLSIVLCAEQCETVSLVNLTYDDAFSKYSPGILLYLEVLRILEEKKKAFLYLGSGDYPYKRLFHSLPFQYYVGDVHRVAP